MSVSRSNPNEEENVCPIKLETKSTGKAIREELTLMSSIYIPSVCFFLLQEDDDDQQRKFMDTSKDTQEEYKPVDLNMHPFDLNKIPKKESMYEIVHEMSEIFFPSVFRL